MKKVVIFSLLLIVVLAFSACGNGGGTDAGAGAGGEVTPAAGDAATPAAGAGDAASGAVNPAGVFPIVDEPITISAFASHIGWVADFVDNRFTEWYEEFTNISVDWQLVSPADVETRLNLQLAAGDLPDIIIDPWVVTNTQLVFFGDAGIFLPLNDMIDRYGIEIQRVLNGNPLVRQLITQDNGNIYALPQVDMCYHCLFPDKFWVYQPWLDELGLSKPTTTVEFTDMLRAFRDNIPNSIPLTGTQEGMNMPSITRFFMNSFIYTDEYMLKLVNDVVTPVFNTPEWREGLRFLNMLYNEGLLAGEAFTQDGAQMHALNGVDGIRIGSFPSLVSWGALSGGPGDPEWTNYTPITPLQGPGGVRYARHRAYSQGYMNAFIITHTNPFPEASFRWADAMYDMEITMRKYYGRIDQEIRFANPDEIGINGLPAIWTILTESGAEHDQPNHAAWAHIGPHYRSADFRHGQTVEAGVPHPEKVLYLATRDYFEPFAPLLSTILPPPTFTEQQANDLMDVQVTINNHVSEMFALFVLGIACLDNDWDSYVQNLDAMGLDRFVQIHQDAFLSRWR